MEIDILDSLDDLGYDKKLTESDVTTAIKEGVKNINFTDLVSWLSKELQVMCELEDSVNSIKDPEDTNSFMLELSSFLKEINCPHKVLMEGPVSQRLINDNQRKTLLDFLCTELQAARIVSQRTEKRGFMEIEMDETHTARHLKETLSLLGLDIPKEEITAEEIVKNIEQRAKMLSLDPENAPLLVGPDPLLTDTLTESQWSSLKSIQEEMHNEYKLRRQMLLKRLDVTIQSFKWGEELKKKEDKIMESYLPIRKTLQVEPSVQLSDVLAACTSCAIIEKTSSSKVLRHGLNEMYKHVMGNVPDRGGRAREMYPAKEMPSWKKRSGDPFSGGSGRGGGGRGNWSNRGKKRFDGTDRGRNRRQAFDAAGSYGN